jgi:hypothetical protein
MKDKPVNLQASVAARLRNIARDKKADFELVLRRYAIERLLYRLTLSDHRDRFVLKGAMLFAAWAGDPFRPTKDVDLLGYGESAASAVAQTFQDICRQAVDEDALLFDADKLQAEPIRDAQEYPGVRVRLTAFLGKVRIPVQIDVGFGDVITPAAIDLEFPPLLDTPPPRLKAYPKETVVAEKLEAIVDLGEANSRMKDYYDLIALSRLFAFDGQTLSQAVAATFKRRNTEIPADRPPGLSTAFATDTQKAAMWTAFHQREALLLPVGEFPETVDEIAAFAMPVVLAARSGDVLSQSWQPGGPWRASLSGP